MKTRPFSSPRTAPCGCQNCLCRRGPRCRCHDYNALLALALWDFGRMARLFKPGRNSTES